MIQEKLTPADKIINSTLYGDPRGFGYDKTGKEIFDEARKKLEEESEDGRDDGEDEFRHELPE